MPLRKILLYVAKCGIIARTYSMFYRKWKQSFFKAAENVQLRRYPSSCLCSGCILKVLGLIFNKFYVFIIYIFTRKRLVSQQSTDNRCIFR